jgi:hypothetical protein
MDEKDYIAMNKKIKESTMKDKVEFAAAFVISLVAE